MRIEVIEKVKPAKENIIVRQIELETQSELYFAKDDAKNYKNAPLSIGEVIATGPNANDDTQCPGVTIGDRVIYNTFAGSHLATSKLDELYKIMGGYSIMATLDDINNINEETAKPTSNRILVAVKFVDETEFGVFIPAEDAKDPRLEDIEYGVVVKTGPSCKLGYKLGDIVGYQPFAGENVRNAESAERPALRVLIEEDVLLSI